MTTTDDTVNGAPARLSPRLVGGAAYKAAQALNKAAGEGLDKPLLELVKVHASQLNGCAFCLDMHATLARSHGETDQRMLALAAWRETPFFTARERAALALTEAVTLLDGGVPDEVWQEAAEHFPDEELSQLVWTIATINAFNRVGVATHAWKPGSYRLPPAS